MSELFQRITDYLATGGLINPEYANHEVVRDLLIDCRKAIGEMKDFKDMTHEEKVNLGVGQLCLAIGAGKFRDAVASLIGAVSAEAFNRGKQYAYEHPVPAPGDIPSEMRNCWKERPDLNKHVGTIGLVFSKLAKMYDDGSGGSGNDIACEIEHILDADTCAEIIAEAQAIQDQE